MQEPKYMVTNETGNVKMYIYNVNLDVLYDVVRFKAEWPKARVPKELWEELLMILDALWDTVEALNDKCTAMAQAVEDINRCVPSSFMPSGMRAEEARRNDLLRAVEGLKQGKRGS